MSRFTRKHAVKVVEVASVAELQKRVGLIEDDAARKRIEEVGGKYVADVVYIWPHTSYSMIPWDPSEKGVCIGTLQEFRAGLADELRRNGPLFLRHHSAMGLRDWLISQYPLPAPVPIVVPDEVKSTITRKKAK
jgi:hypothetical protein